MKKTIRNYKIIVTLIKRFLTASKPTLNRNRKKNKPKVQNKLKKIVISAIRLLVFDTSHVLLHCHYYLK